MHEFVSVDISKCVGCRICEYACSMEKHNEMNPNKSRIRVVRIYPTTNAALNCRMCEDAACVIACPRKALTQSNETGIILVNDNLCNGCGWCIKVCEFGAIFMDPKPTVCICDLCQERENGPACIEWCPEDALELSTTNILAQKARFGAVERLVSLTQDI